MRVLSCNKLAGQTGLYYDAGLKKFKWNSAEINAFFASGAYICIFRYQFLLVTCNLKATKNVKITLNLMLKESSSLSVSSSGSTNIKYYT